MAVLDQNGRITEVNAAWVAFANSCVRRQPATAQDFVGVDYLAVCDSVNEDEARAAAETLRAVMSGQVAHRTMEYRCDTPEGDPRWFTSTAAALEPGGVVVIHSDITDRRLLELRLERAVQFDTLTGVASRVDFSARAEARLLSAAEAGQKLHLLFLDLDRFKEINDTYGHPHGDAVLRAIGDRLRHRARDGDLIGRIGGDEFVMLIAADDPNPAIARITRLFADPFAIDGRLHMLGTSVGAATFPADGADLPTLLRVADDRMYAQKGRQPKGDATDVARHRDT